jgi:hypothetical protein
MMLTVEWSPFHGVILGVPFFLNRQALPTKQTIGPDDDAPISLGQFSCDTSICYWPAVRNSI